MHGVGVGRVGHGFRCSSVCRWPMDILVPAVLLHCPSRQGRANLGHKRVPPHRSQPGLQATPETRLAARSGELTRAHPRQ
jgi:hypothetical protein